MDLNIIEHKYGTHTYLCDHKCLNLCFSNPQLWKDQGLAVFFKTATAQNAQVYPIKEDRKVLFQADWLHIRFTITTFKLSIIQCLLPLNCHRQLHATETITFKYISNSDSNGSHQSTEDFIPKVHTHMPLARLWLLKMKGTILALMTFNLGFEQTTVEPQLKAGAEREIPLKLPFYPTHLSLNTLQIISSEAYVTTCTKTNPLSLCYHEYIQDDSFTELQSKFSTECANITLKYKNYHVQGQWQSSIKLVLYNLLFSYSTLLLNHIIVIISTLVCPQPFSQD